MRAARVEHAGVVETAVGAAEARRVAGTGDDPLKVIEDLPGVARAAVGTGAIIVWGAAPNDTRVLIDGVEVPALFHVGGWRSIVNGDLVGRVALTPGGFGADYGRGLGGLVRVETAAPPAAGLHGYVAADLLDGSALVSYASGRFSVTVAGRYGWLDRVAGAVVSPDVQAFVPLPRYDDYQVKATIRLRWRETLSLLFLGADDALRRSVFAGDPSQARSDSLTRSMWRLALHYVRDVAGAHVEVTPFFGFDRNHTAEQFGPTPANLAVDDWTLGVRASYRKLVARRLALVFGLDVLDTHATVARFGSLTIPPREGDPYVFGQPPGTDVASDHFGVQELDAAPYVSGELRLGPLTITPGLRFDALYIEGDHLTPPVAAAPPLGFTHLTASLDPRLALRWLASSRVALTAAFGVYHQPPDPVDLGARFGDPHLTASRALHVTAGGELHIAAGLSAELDGFYRQLDGLATRSLLPAPPVGQALVQEGIGRSYGGQLFVRQAPWHGVSGWISYTLSRSERRDHPSTAWRLFDGDQTHVLTIVGGYRYRHWDFGLRFRYSSGFPRTPVVGAYWDASNNRYDPLFGAINSTRIPDFIQLDLRAEYAFVWTRWTLRLYLDAQNVTWQRNPEEIVYNESYTQRGYITGLPTLAVLGVRVQF
ncbi:MAG TPA: hypothetical protein VIA18_18505 [Polyangia bacterium]|nr:hypothetical protein [Polyangia bacterium]